MPLKIVNGQLGVYAAPTAAGAALTEGETAADQRTTLSAAAKSQIFAVDRLIEVVADKVYTLVLNARHGGVITSTTTKCASGTATATFKINATALGGTANAVSSTEQSQAHATNGTFVAGDDITMTISANSTCLDLAVSILYTRTLA